MNQKGFIATSLIYSFFLMFIIILTALLNSYISNSTISKKFNDDISEKLDKKAYTIQIFVENASINNKGVYQLYNIIKEGNLPINDEGKCSLLNEKYWTSNYQSPVIKNGNCSFIITNSIEPYLKKMTYKICDKANDPSCELIKNHIYYLKYNFYYETLGENSEEAKVCIGLSKPKASDSICKTIDRNSLDKWQTISTIFKAQDYSEYDEQVLLWAEYNDENLLSGKVYMNSFALIDITNIYETRIIKDEKFNFFYSSPVLSESDPIENGIYSLINGNKLPQKANLLFDSVQTFPYNFIQTETRKSSVDLDMEPYYKNNSEIKYSQYDMTCYNKDMQQIENIQINNLNSEDNQTSIKTRISNITQDMVCKITWK